MRTSQLEQKWREFFIYYFDFIEFEYNIRPDFLKNPFTGRNLELDLFSRKYKLAIEVDGEQHYRFTPKFHRKREDFNKQILRDKVKEMLCYDENIFLVRVSRKSNEEEVYRKVKRYLRDRL